MFIFLLSLDKVKGCFVFIHLLSLDKVTVAAIMKFKDCFTMKYVLVQCGLEPSPSIRWVDSPCRSGVCDEADFMEHPRLL